MFAGSSSDFFKPTKKRKFFDGLSDDEEYQNMTEEERNEKMAPKNMDQLDGAITDEEEDDDELITSSTTNGRKKKANNPFKDDSDHENDGHVGRSMSPDSDDIPDLDESKLDDEEPDDGKSDSENNGEKRGKGDFQLTDEQIKNLVVPPRMPANLNGRRRATLIVTPASLISHWLGQIEQHVDKRVDLSIFVHHGQSKAMLGKDLEDQDIVLTTYGTLQSELNDKMHGPLLRAKWLRVCLDEGHFIKNHRAKTAKAAANLDTKRKWIISGTPIQNNLTELWSLLAWLEEPTYGCNRPAFKHDIEYPVKQGCRSGVIRLQTLVEAVCLRRTKQDKVNGKPLVTLPEKIVSLRELEFTKDERTVYEAYQKQAQKIVERYMKKATLLKNYAHIFALMMRLRQLCCHRDLLPIKWHDVDMDELLQIVAEEATRDQEDSEEDLERAKELAEQLRNMIRDGMSDECAICLSEFDHPVITPCAHVYCRPCIVQHIETAPQPPAMCPLCRGPLEVRTLLEAARDEENEDGNAENPYEDIIVECSSTKVNAVLKELALTRKTKPGEKTIVVSQFTSLLSILQPLLNQDGYNWVRLDGTMSTRHRSEVIAEFQDTSAHSPTVLLLSLRAGKHGLHNSSVN